MLLTASPAKSYVTRDANKTTSRPKHAPKFSEYFLHQFGVSLYASGLDVVLLQMLMVIAQEPEPKPVVLCIGLRIQIRG